MAGGSGRAPVTHVLVGQTRPTKPDRPNLRRTFRDGGSEQTGRGMVECN